VEKGVGIEFSPDPSFTSGATRGVPGEADLVASANITMDPSGIAFYTEDVFIKTIRTGRVAGIRALNAAMPWVFFKEMTDADLRAIFAYLNRVPLVRHRVSNFDPPTFCPLCGRRHGLGELNTGREVHSSSVGRVGIPVPTVLRAGPYRFYFYSGDRDEPPHVHVARDANEAKFWLEPVRLF
jgi:hypothetical protein